MLRARLHKKFFYSIITMFLSFNMMNPTFVKASEKREIKSNKNIIIMVDQNSEKGLLYQLR